MPADDPIAPIAPTTPSGVPPRRVRAAIDCRCAAGRCEGPTVWLPWCIAPVWVFLPIIGCLVAGFVRQRAAASGPPEPVTAVESATEVATVGLVPIVPLATIDPS